MMNAAPGNLVLISSPRAARVVALKRCLEAVGMRGVRAGASLEGALEEFDPRVVVVDAAGSPAEAIGICAAIRSARPDVSVLLIAVRGDAETVEQALELGISQFAEEPMTLEVLALRIRALALAAGGGATGRERRIGAPPGCDGLTGLASRPSFVQTMNRVIEQARERGHLAALLYLDIDRFKAVNDALGHATGDVLLKHVARILETQVRATDLVVNGSAREEGADVSRIGGDEFTVLLSKVRRAEDAVDVAHRIIEAMKSPISAHGYQVAATASIGIAIFPDDGADAESLLRSADMAMYAAKAYGRGRALPYQPSMGEVHDRRLAVEEALRSALEQGELEVHYQPRVDLANDVISGVEALLRWHSEELGEVPPKEFVPVAEESGLILPIGKWVLETACRQLAQWRQDGWSDLRLSVNVSSQQFASSDVLRMVTDVLRATGVEPHALELEVTERLMLGGDESTALSLRDLRGIGVTISLDDFGTGYSSLSSITRYPLDVLKIDRSIAAAVEGDPAAASIVAAVVTLGRSLGLGIVAEGVDAPGQARMLIQLGCDDIQGFLVSPAVEASQFEDLYRGWQGLEQCKTVGTSGPSIGDPEDSQDLPAPVEE
jgi:diguanylate cyclase (GGDEF)-like protein